MAGTWVIVADSTRARFFNWHANRQLEEIDVLVSPDNRLHESELVSDRQGRIDAAGGARHGIGHRNTAKEHEEDVFARQVASRVEQGRTSGQVGKLVIVATPKFLGRIRSSLNGPCTKLIVHTVDKELTRLLPDELNEHLPDFI